MVESSEDEESERDFSKEEPLRDGSPGSPVKSQENRHGGELDGTNQDVGVGVSLCVSRLCGAGYLEELQWLEAYLLDEARDRTVDGKG